VVNNIDETPSLLRNDGGNRRHWIGLRLVGAPRNKGAIGARVTLVAGSLRQTKEVRAGSSHNSSSDPRLLFGLGDATAVAKRYRELYGYGAAYRALFAGIAGVLGVFTVPVLFAGDEAIFPFFISAVVLAIAFAFLIWTSVAAGNRAALVAGLVALVGRWAGLIVALVLNRGASLVTADGLALFGLVSVLLVLVAWIPGKAKETWKRPSGEL